MEIKRIDGTIIGDFKSWSIQAALGSAINKGVSFENVNLKGKDLRRGNFDVYCIWGGRLKIVNFQGANLEGTDLRMANLRNMNLENANLQNADLRRTNLIGANLKEADLQGADLENAILHRATIEGIKGITKYRTPELQELLDRPDPIMAYKLVDTEGYGPYNGGIKYEIGKEVRVGGANIDVRVGCGAGINVASLPWVMEKWESEYRILTVEFNTADIAAIPIGTDGKFRLHRCRVVEEKDIKELKKGIQWKSNG